ncbi:MAG: hypothetical protein EP307_09130 [Rhodobacteraceae bacterium]|nr:MAG: hypothetical protein EP307_09130 [Paracoccaceae bacterium]
MSFIRPQARATLWRLREVISAAGLAALGLYWLTSHGLVFWLGALCLAVALGLALVGIQRARFRLGAGGPGVVSLDEGQIAYFGPLTGGVVAIADLTCLTLDPTGQPTHWVLEHTDGPPLHIPVTAEGAEVLFDAFAALPGIRTERMLAELRGQGRVPVVIWQRQRTGAARLRVH